MAHPTNVPPFAVVPSGAPFDPMAVAHWMTQFSPQLNAWAALVVAATNSLVNDTLAAGVTGGTGLTKYTLASLIAQLKSTGTIPS